MSFLIFAPMAAAAKRGFGGGGYGGASQEAGSGLPDEESQREQLVLSLCRRAEWARVEVSAPCTIDIL